MRTVKQTLFLLAALALLKFPSAARSTSPMTR